MKLALEKVFTGCLKFECNHASCIFSSYAGVPRIRQPHHIPPQVTSLWFLKGHSGADLELFQGLWSVQGRNDVF